MLRARRNAGRHATPDAAAAEHHPPLESLVVVLALQIHKVGAPNRHPEAQYRLIRRLQ